MPLRISKKIIKRYAPDFIKPEDVFSSDVILKTSNLDSDFQPKRATIFLAIIFLALLLLLFKSASLSIIENNYYSNLAFLSQHKIIYIPSPRGVIYDKNGKVLATNKKNFEVYILSAYLPKNQRDFEQWLSKASQLLGISYQEIKDKLSDQNIFLTDRILLFELDDIVKVELLKEKLKDFGGIEIVETFKRIYPYAPYASHILGYTSRKNNFEKIGQDGVELIKNEQLEGKPGKEIYQIDSKGNVIKKEDQIKPIEGKDVYLTIDIEIQKKLEDIFESYLKNHQKSNGAAVALDPRDGKIIAMASFPRYDNNNIVQYLNDKNQPLFNRAIAGQYPSGSTIKPAIALAALNEKIISPDRQILVTGSISVESEFDPAVKYTFKDWRAHGYVNLTKAIAVSSNVYFYTIGGGYQDIKGLGPIKIAQYLKMFNFGNKTGIDLPGEAAGLIPTPEWKKQTKNENWYLGDTYHLSIGQGDLKVTPLQMAILNAIIANNGNIVRPHIISENCLLEQTLCDIVKPLNNIDKKNIEIVKNGMRLAVTEGSAKLLSDLPVKVAGKTGTAQVNLKDEPHSWFEAFAPYDDPKIVIVAIVENGGEGTAIATPIVKDFLKFYFGD